jgi:hypothetical protein
MLWHDAAQPYSAVKRLQAVNIGDERFHLIKTRQS